MTNLAGPGARVPLLHELLLYDVTNLAGPGARVALLHVQAQATREILVAAKMANVMWANWLGCGSFAWLDDADPER